MTKTTAPLPDYTQQIEALRAASDFVTYALALAKNLPSSDYPPQYQKAAVDLLTTGNTEALQRQSLAFVEVLSKRTLLGQMIPATTTAPPFTSIGTSIDDDRDVEWVGEGQPAPVVRLSTSASARTDTGKIALILPLVREVVRSLDPRARRWIEQKMLQRLRRGEDRKLLDDQAAVEHERPAGLLYGLSPVGGGSPASLADLEELWTAVRDGDLDRPYYITSPRGAMYLASRNTDGIPGFPNASPRGTGSIADVPLLVSAAAGEKLILIDAAQLVVTDDGLTVEPSENAACQMDDTPSDGPVQVISGWQTNMTFLRFTRFVSWLLAADDAIAFIELPIAGSPA